MNKTLLRARVPWVGLTIAAAVLALLLAVYGLASAATAAAGVVVNPTAAAGSGHRGQIVTYSLRMTNTGTLTDIFTVTISGNSWFADMFIVPGTVLIPNTKVLVSLNPGEGRDVSVLVHIPADAVGEDTVTFQALSSVNPGVSAIALLTTSVFFTLYLPLIVRSG